MSPTADSELWYEAGTYEIQSPLGASGIGEVYRGRDTPLDRTVAIKFPDQKSDGCPEE